MKTTTITIKFTELENRETLIRVENDGQLNVPTMIGVLQLSLRELINGNSVANTRISESLYKQIVQPEDEK